MHKNFHNLVLGVSVLPALLVLPAISAEPITDKPVFVLGDITLDSTDQVSVGKAAFAGRRMDNWQGGRYQNDFPKYQIVAQSLTADGSDMYVGPVTLTLRELTDADEFTFNWQANENDIDLAHIAGIGWNESYDDIEENSEVVAQGVFNKVANIIEPGNATYTAPTVHQFSQKDNEATKAGILSFKNTTAMVDGSTIKAKTINVTDGSVLTFGKQDRTKLTAFLDGDIDSDGITTLNVDTINVDGSLLDVKPGAKLVINNETPNHFH